MKQVIVVLKIVNRNMRCNPSANESTFSILNVTQGRGAQDNFIFLST